MLELHAQGTGGLHVRSHQQHPARVRVQAVDRVWPPVGTAPGGVAVQVGHQRLVELRALPAPPGQHWVSGRLVDAQMAGLLVEDVQREGLLRERAGPHFLRQGDHVPRADGLSRGPDAGVHPHPPLPDQPAQGRLRAVDEP